MKNALALRMRTCWAGFKAVVVFTAIAIAYTLMMVGIGQLGFPSQANGSMIANGEGEVVGSSLIGQPFTDANGRALPQYFQSRPSAAGDGYDASASGATNKGHQDEELIASVEERRAAIAEREGVDVDDVPADAVTASASGLDPHISPEYAAIQVERVAEARGLGVGQVEELVRLNTTGRGLGFIGEPVVNVVTLNLALDELA
ncbi:potassium transporter KtrA [Bifidobacterium lemurum]|uniref:Potassium-transporting ATPase KdpC subunit n=1 Tax=Bifidobacterium lemurum TaxID=1603886 RepID=A0A261FR50_9BIFI|nr:K(+)-transporting ATPase subunit C [Bifidobacterium lemurum]OZG61433.1 potassium transporter KtrA [Bifidobacterium lemurum]QOL35137.1 K(+)-transporting ATPase subunit C [Bifidobacterium lemurum]